MKEKLIEGFKKAFGGASDELRFFFAPGRVNLIGEHIDYNGGLVFPCALDLGTYAAIRRRDDDVVRLASADFEPAVTVKIGDMPFDPAHGWANYPKGVVSCLDDLGKGLPHGFDLCILGDLPNGAGLSSSASVCMVVATALNAVFELGMNPVELAKLCQKAEFYNGVNCGIMDQFASVMGKKDCGILLNCNTLEYSHVPLNLGDYRIVIANTNKRRGLADSKYNERRAECEEALADLQKVCNVKALCDLTPEEFEKHEHAIRRQIPRMRAIHAVDENARVKSAAEAIQNGRWQEFAGALNGSHTSLSELYEVSCDELDALVDAAQEYNDEFNAVYGSRMTGAGFGGCTVNIVHKDHTEKFAEFVGKAYELETELKADFYVAVPGDGAREI